MNRGIKFRVWLQRKNEKPEMVTHNFALEQYDPAYLKQGVYADQEGPYDPLRISSIDVGKNERQWSDLTPCVLMQWTGAVDCNGVEIYEGDILENAYARQHREENPWLFLSQRLYTPEWASGQPRYHLRNLKGGPVSLFEEPCEWVVIGNIYEYPHLIPEPVATTA